MLSKQTIIRKKRYILAIIIVFFIVASLNSVTIANIFVGRVGHILTNLIQGNFKQNSELSSLGIILNIDKMKWTYTIKRSTDRIIINFTGDIIEIKNSKYIFQKADMHILDMNISQETFLQIAKANIGECHKRKVYDNSKQQEKVNLTFCDNNSIIHYDIINKRVLLSYFPYNNRDDEKKSFEEFISGIEFTD